MVINENNSQINAFVKGMNSDTAYDQVDNQQYVFGKNIRVTKNDFVGGTSGDVASLHEGVITPVSAGKVLQYNNLVYNNGETFLASDSIGDIAVVVTYGNHKLNVYKYTFNNNTDEVTHNWKWYVETGNKEINAVSTVMYQELEKVIKLYIATGEYPIIELRVDGDVPQSTNVDDYINNRKFPKKPVYINNIISGQLKTSQVQYTYRYYNKFGNTTQLAPLTNKIQIIDSNRSKEVGNAQDTATAIGLELVINRGDISSYYNRLQIYRLSYVVPGQDANVELIFDGDTDTSTFTFKDVGTAPLQELTMQEFAALSGMVIIPKVIEQNQQYMFAANVTDDTIIENVKITEPELSTKTFHVTITTSDEGVPVQSNDSFTDSEQREYFQDRNINPNLPKNSYNNIFTSSLLRSLRRGESYHYGIVYYDKYGRHTNVLKLGEKAIPEIYQGCELTNPNGSLIHANPIGISFQIPTPNTEDPENPGSFIIPYKDMVGCQIVRRSAKQVYQKTLLQVAISTTVAQDLLDTDIQGTAAHSEIISSGNLKNPSWSTYNISTKTSPYYPSGFLLSGKVSTVHGYYWYSGSHQDEDHTFYCPAYTRDNKLYMALSNEFDFRRDDVMSSLQSNVLQVDKVAMYGLSGNQNPRQAQSVYQAYARKNINSVSSSLLWPEISGSSANKTITFSLSGDVVEINRLCMSQDPSKKANEHILFPLYHCRIAMSHSSIDKKDIKSIKDTKNAEWFDGFSNVQISGGDILGGAIKKYQTFVTNIDGNSYNNWVSSGLYDLRITEEDYQANLEGQHEATTGGINVYISKDETADTSTNLDDRSNRPKRHDYATRGYIGPGPSCFLFTPSEMFNVAGFDTVLCNITHQPSMDHVESDEFVQYFGFGNFFPLTWNESAGRYDIDGKNDNTAVVFDGDIYITPHELTTMFKTYDFISVDTLKSMQVVNYIPMESKVNTFFDYGMNYRNTSSTNLLLEPGTIDGVTTQDRPLHQYNQIYSANDESNDVFTLKVEKPEDNNFKQRTYYSEPKTNGEYVDNFVIFKPAAYIDVDPKYGQITNLLTDKNILYYWQETGFGKFSVNERSLINDQNGNTIMLGQAGILSRNDYISTKYGMRMYDFCATCAENGVFWADINNKAVVGADSSQAINLGEVRNVQNIINRKISEDIPRMDYDLQNNELLCKCLQDGEQIIFNLKANIATSLYTREYEDIVSIHNHLYGITKNNFCKYNYLKKQNSYLHPVAISFIVNPSASTTKVFDSQMLVPAKRKAWNGTEPEYTSLVYTFETDIMYTNNNVEQKTDREGNIIYNIPRFGSGDYGNRLRGKWMRVNISADNPDEFTTISHVITKFRQSYS